jgi:hypothetical protein
MRTEELISTLVADLAPVRRLRNADTRTVLWASLALVCGGLGTFLLGVRPDLQVRLVDSTYLAEGVALLVLFASSARCAFALTVPGNEVGVLKRNLPVLALVAWILLVAARTSSIGFSLSPGLRCVWRMLALGLAPAAAAFFMLRKAAPRKRGRTGLFALLSVAALGSLGTHIICTRDAPGHILVWHAAPLVVTVLIGIAAGAFLLRRTP